MDSRSSLRKSSRLRIATAISGLVVSLALCAVLAGCGYLDVYQPGQSHPSRHIFLGFNTAQDVAISPRSGDVYVAMSGRPILIFAAGGGPLRAKISAGIASPTHLAFDAPGDLLVVNRDDVTCYEPANHRLIARLRSDAGYPRQVAADAKGDVFVLYNGAAANIVVEYGGPAFKPKRVLLVYPENPRATQGAAVFTPRTLIPPSNTGVAVTTSAANPIAVTPGGTLYVASWQSGRVRVFLPGRDLPALTLPAHGRFLGLPKVSTDNLGRLYISHGGRLDVYDAGGQRLLYTRLSTAPVTTVVSPVGDVALTSAVGATAILPVPATAPASSIRTSACLGAIDRLGRLYYFTCN